MYRTLVTWPTSSGSLYKWKQSQSQSWCSDNNFNAVSDVLPTYLIASKVGAKSLMQTTPSDLEPQHRHWLKWIYLMSMGQYEHRITHTQGQLYFNCCWVSGTRQLSSFEKGKTTQNHNIFNSNSSIWSIKRLLVGFLGLLRPTCNSNGLCLEVDVTFLFALMMVFASNS